MPKFIVLVAIVSVIGLTIYFLDRLTNTDALSEALTRRDAAAALADVKQEPSAPQQHEQEEVKVSIETPPEKEEEKVVIPYQAQKKLPSQTQETQVFEAWENEPPDPYLRETRSRPPTAMRSPRSTARRTPRSQSLQ